MTKYSFDPSKIVNGPFNTEEEAWDAMESIADEEHRIDTDENGWRTQIIKNKTCGEITIKNFFTAGTDVTEFFLFEI
jgi:hypothetical protein